MSEPSLRPEEQNEAPAEPIDDAERVIKEHRIVTDGRASTTQVEEATVVVPSAATISRRRYIRVRRTIYTIVNIIAIFIFVRFLLTLFGADPLNGFASFIYGITYPFVLPFRGLFGPGVEPQLGNNVFDVSCLVAIAIFYLFAWIGSKVAQIVSLRQRAEPAEAGSAAR